MSRPCTCDKCTKGSEFVQGDCFPCWKYWNDPLYKNLWDGPDKPVKHTPLVQCSYLGPEVKEDNGETTTRECESCGGKTRLKVFQCTHPAREPDEVTMGDCRHCAYRPKHPDAKPIILRNHLSPGDVTCMSAAIYSLHKAYPDRFATAVDTSCNAIYEHNPDIIPLAKALEMGAEKIDMHYNAVNECNQRAIHFMEAYCEHLENCLNLRIPLKTNRPHIYLSKQEKSWMSQVQEITGKPTKYWLVNAGVKQDYTAKQWPYFEQLVNQLHGKILFVQVGKSHHLHRPLKGAINLLDKTDDRQFIRLVSHCEGIVCGTTWLMHLAAAFDKPAIVLAGGREPRPWNSYPRQQLLSMVGMLPCCRESCWKSRVVKLNDGDGKDNELCEYPAFTDPPAPKCLAMISADEVSSKILQFQS
jgi:ADP-heptose:LPS heptosyltransferase